MDFSTKLLRYNSGVIFFHVKAVERKMSTCSAHGFWFGLFYAIHFSKEDEEWKEFEQREVDYSGLRLQALQMRWGGEKELCHYVEGRKKALICCVTRY